MTQEKKTWKMWGLFYPDGHLQQVTFDKSDLTRVFDGVFKSNPNVKKVLKIKRVTVIEGNYYLKRD